MDHSGARRFIALQSMPVPVRFAGMESDTVRMGRAGWRFAFHEDMRAWDMREVIHVVAHHPGLKLSMTGRLHNARAILEDRMEFMRIHRRAYPEGQDGVIELQYAATKGEFRLVGHVPFSGMAWHDTEPVWTEVDSVNELHRLPLFASIDNPAPETQELIVDPACVMSLLNRIQDLQAPGMAEIRARSARREREDNKPKRVHAQIVSLAA